MFNVHLLHRLLQFLPHRRLFGFLHGNSCIFLKCSCHHIHILRLKEHQISSWCHTVVPFQAVINAIFTGNPVKGFDILVCDLNIGQLRSLFLQLLDCLLAMGLFLFLSLFFFFNSTLPGLTLLLCLFDLR